MDVEVITAEQVAMSILCDVCKENNINPLTLLYGRIDGFDFLSKKEKIEKKSEVLKSLLENPLIKGVNYGSTNRHNKKALAAY